MEDESLENGAGKLRVICKQLACLIWVVHNVGLGRLIENSIEVSEVLTYLHLC
jgi:hypothetical protein